MARLHLIIALRNDIPAVADVLYFSGEKLNVYRDNHISNLIVELLRPHKVAHTEENNKLTYRIIES